MTSVTTDSRRREQRIDAKEIEALLKSVTPGMILGFRNVGIYQLVGLDYDDDPECADEENPSKATHGFSDSDLRAMAAVYVGTDGSEEGCQICKDWLTDNQRRKFTGYEVVDPDAVRDSIDFLWLMFAPPASLTDPVAWLTDLAAESRAFIKEREEYANDHEAQAKDLARIEADLQYAKEISVLPPGVTEHYIESAGCRWPVPAYEGIADFLSGIDAELEGHQRCPGAQYVKQNDVEGKYTGRDIPESANELTQTTMWVIAAVHKKYRGSLLGLLLLKNWIEQWPHLVDMAGGEKGVEDAYDILGAAGSRKISDPTETFNWLANLSAEARKATEAKKSYSSRCIADVPVERMKPLWKDRLFLGKLAQFAGMPKTGKSQGTCLFAKCTTTGVWPDGQIGPVGSVIFITTEDAVGDTIKPRLLAAGADVKKCHILDWARERDGAKGIKQLQFDVAHHMPQLEQMCRDIGDVRMVVIDPISAYLGKADSHNNAEFRGALAPLQALAEKLEFAGILINHFNKNSSERSALLRSSGSGALGAVCRTNWMFCYDPGDPTKRRRLFAPMGANVGRKGGEGFTYTIEDVDLPGPDGAPIETSRAVFDTMPTRLDADDILGRAGAGSEARSFIKSELAAGPVPSAELKARALAAGHSPATYERERKSLGVRSRRVGDRWLSDIPEIVEHPIADGALDTDLFPDLA